MNRIRLALLFLCLCSVIASPFGSANDVPIDKPMTADIETFAAQYGDHQVLSRSYLNQVKFVPDEHSSEDSDMSERPV